jgi:tRNA threonylcarbamoyladenosine biosynthesis protein TsaE
MPRLVTHSPDQTIELGCKLGTAVKGSLAFYLAGSYGTGKTTFAQGLAQGLGVVGPVRSPSYSIVKTYLGASIGFIHADLYRMKSAAEIYELGLQDLLDGESVIAVEWPGTVEGFGLGMPFIELTFGFADEKLTEFAGDIAEARVIELAFSEDCPAAMVEVARALAA